MENFENFMTRRQSCRNFNGEPVEREKLEALVEAVRLSPSACNAQPWRVIMATGETAKLVRESVQEGGRNKFTDNCPAFAVMVEEHATLKPAVAEKFHSQAFAQIDIGIATAHYCLAATDLGLSTCILGWMNEERLKENLGIAPEKRVRLVLATGYAAADDELRVKKRKTTEEMAEFRD